MSNAQTIVGQNHSVIMGEINEMNVFEKLYGIDCNEHKEGKNGFAYLSWTWAWAEVKKNYPDAVYSIKRFENNLPYVYDEKTGYMVFTEVTINGLTHEMWLPVMDNLNNAMLSEPYKYKTKSGQEKWVKAANMFDINKTIMRCLVKNLAVFGLGLYIYAGEDLPEEIEDEPKDDKPDKKPAKPKAAPKKKDLEPEKPKFASSMQVQAIKDLCLATGKKEKAILECYKVKSLEELTPEDAAAAVNVLRNYEARMAL